MYMHACQEILMRVSYIPNQKYVIFCDVFMNILPCSTFREGFIC